MTTQIVSEFASDDFVPGIAVRARAAVPSSPSANTAMRLLLAGYKTSAGSMTAGTVVGPVTSEDQAAELAGVGSELARGFRAGRARSKDVEMWFGAVEEPAGVAAYATITISGSWTEAGEVVIWVDGDPLYVVAGASDSASDFAAAVEAKSALYPAYSYAAVAAGAVVTLTKNNVGPRGNSSILYVDTTSAPSGMVVTLEPPLAALLSRVVELRADFIAHIALTTGSVHGAADSGPYTIGSAPTNQATSITVLGQLLTAAKAHVQKTAGSVHGASDATALAALNALTAPTTGAEAVAFANSFATIFFGASGHAQRTTSSIHGAADTTNVITTDDAITGAVTGDADTGDGVRFASGTGTEDVSTLVSALESDPVWYKRIVPAALDATNAGRWEVFADEMGGPMVGRPLAFVTAHVGSQSAAQAISKTQCNHEAFEVLWGYDAETPAFEIACVHAVERVLTERAGPEGWNKSYSNTILPGVRLARDKSKLASDHATQKSALQNGLSPLNATSTGEAMLVRAIWTRCQNSDGSSNYLGLDVAEWTSLQEVRERAGNTWRFYRVRNDHVRDDFGKEPTVPATATPSGWRQYLFASVGQEMVAARVFEALPTIRATYNRNTKRIQWELDYSRMPLHEQSEGVVTSFG